jgi:hypothetical protein
MDAVGIAVDLEDKNAVSFCRDWAQRLIGRTQLLILKARIA